MGLSRLQGTSGYIGYFGSQEGKRTRHNCDHYERFAQCCFREKKIQACKSPGRCKYHTENTAVTLLEIEKENKLRDSKKHYSTYPKQEIKKTKKQIQRAHRINENKNKCRKCFYFNAPNKMCNYNRKEIPEKGKGSECKYQINRQDVSEKQAYQLNRQLSLKFNEIIKTPKIKKNVKKKIVRQNDRVKLINLTKKLMVDIQLVSQKKHNDFEYKISVNSPLGKAIHNQEVGEIVKVNIQGKEEIYKIVSIT